MLKKLEALTNVAILVVAVLAGAALVRQLRAPAAVAGPPQLKVGAKVELKGIDWRANGSTLVMAIQTTCHFCSESAPFYRRLAAELPKAGVHITAVLPQPKPDGIAYLKTLLVDVSDVRQDSFRDLQIKGTPTLILVDANGVARQVWFGRLPPEREQEVLNVVLGARGN